MIMAGVKVKVKVKGRVKGKGKGKVRVALLRSAEPSYEGRGGRQRPAKPRRSREGGAWKRGYWIKVIG
jgi:hypothetical protein